MTKKDRLRNQQFNYLNPVTLNRFYGVLHKNTIYEQYDLSIYKNALYNHFVGLNGNGFLVYYKVNIRTIRFSRIKTRCKLPLYIGDSFSSDKLMKFTCWKCKYIILKNILKK